MDGLTLNIENMKNTVIQIFDIGEDRLAGRPPSIYVEGPPGAGKSEGIRQAAEELARRRGVPFVANPSREDFAVPDASNTFFFIDIRLAQLSPVDIRGLPARGPNDETIWLKPEFLPQVGMGIVFLDELPIAPNATKGAAYQLILDRMVGRHKLGDHYLIVAAGNRGSDRGVHHELPPALMNRFIRLQVAPDLNEWIPWAYRNGIRSEIISFLNFRTELFYQFDPSRDTAQPFPTPRSWRLASLVMDMPAELRAPALEGAIGTGAAGELSAFLRLYESLPNPDHILAGKRVKVPTAPDVNYALMGALVEKLTEDNVPHFLSFVEKLSGEFGILAVRQALKSDKKFLAYGKHQERFNAWLDANEELLA